MNPETLKLFSNSFENNVNNFDEWNDVVASYKDNKLKGDLFEYLTYYLLKYHNEFKNRFKEVYLYNDIPSDIITKLKLPQTDKGIDLICITNEGKYYSVQSKFRSNRDDVIPWNNLSTFVGLTCKNKYFCKGYLFTNCYGVCDEMKNTDKIVNIYGEFFDNRRIGEDFIMNLKNVLKNNLPIQCLTVKYKPLDYQVEIINSAVEYFKDNEKGLLSMACGTGKSLTSYFITEKMNCKKIIIAVPSLMLLSQIYSTYSKQDNYECLLIGSDVEENIKNICVEIETNYDNIKKWVKKHNPKTKKLESAKKQLIITTYHSAELIKNCLNELNVIFDICIYDEAHKTVGFYGNYFTTLLDNNFKVNKRMFMTATPKFYKGNKEDVYCMDNEKIYGKKFYELNMRYAIDNKLLTDYKIITPLATNQQILDYLQFKKLVNFSHNIKVVENVNSEIVDNEIIEDEIVNNEIIQNEIVDNEIVNNEIIQDEIIWSEIYKDDESQITESEFDDSEVDEYEVDESEFEKEVDSEFNSEVDEEMDESEMDESETNESEFIKDSNIVYDSNEVMSVIMLCKLINDDKNIKKILTYHSNVNNAKKFNLLIDKVKDMYNLNGIYHNTLDGNVSMKNRQKIINEFIKSDKGILCSARVLNEGVDIKQVDSVMFVNSRKSIIDVVQCVGRCLRLFEGKIMSNIIIPTIIDNETEKSQDGFQNIFNIIRGLISQDGNIIAYFKEKKENGSSNLIPMIISSFN